MIEYVRGNLLDAPVAALVNPVNTDGIMGAGLAKQFKQKFPWSYTDYHAACNVRAVQIGKMFISDPGTPTSACYPRLQFIIHFPTKKSWRDPSRLSYIVAGLVDLVKKVRGFEIPSLAIPALGCGLGGLQWTDVHPLIVDAFTQLPDVHILLFPPEH